VVFTHGFPMCFFSAGISHLNWLVVWNMNGLWLSIQLGISSSQLTILFRGVKPPTSIYVFFKGNLM
jgi:hypothetical protein